MCGIGGYYKVNGEFCDIKDNMAKMFIALEDRGEDAAGIAWLNGTQDACSYVKNVGRASNLIDKQWDIIDNEPQWCMLHTRMATTGSPENMLNNHPIERFGVILTHNGMIYNKMSIMKKLNIKVKTEVDSEVLPASIGIEGLEWTVNNINGIFTMAWSNIYDDYQKLSLYSNGIMPLWFGIINGTKDVVYASTRYHLVSSELNLEQIIHAIPGYHYKLSPKGLTKTFVGGVQDKTTIRR